MRVCSMSLTNFQEFWNAHFCCFAIFPYFCGRMSSLSSLSSPVGSLSTSPEDNPTHMLTDLREWCVHSWKRDSCFDLSQSLCIVCYRNSKWMCTGPFFLTPSTNIYEVSTKYQEIRPYSHPQQGSSPLAAEEVSIVEHKLFITIISHITSIDIV